MIQYDEISLNIKLSDEYEKNGEDIGLTNIEMANDKINRTYLCL